MEDNGLSLLFVFLGWLGYVLYWDQNQCKELEKWCRMKEEESDGMD